VRNKEGRGKTIRLNASMIKQKKGLVGRQGA